MTDELEDDELCPPDPLRVAQRALVLSAICCRGMIERDPNPEGADGLRVSVREWLDEMGATEEAEAEEQRIIETPVGSLGERDTLYEGWRSEGLTVLSWALSASSLPAFFEQCGAEDAAQALGFLQPREATILADPVLRAASEIECWLDTYLTVHWRIREFDRIGEPIDLPDYVETCGWGPLSVAELQLVDKDLSIDGVAIGDWSQDQFRGTRSIVQERHQAFNWLLGLEELYSQITTDT